MEQTLETTGAENHDKSLRKLSLSVLVGFRTQTSQSLIAVDHSIETISNIATNCTELTELNLDGTYLSEESMNILSKNLSPKMEQLSLYGIRFATGQLIS